MAEPFKGMSLHTYAGERKYLSSAERLRFLEALSTIEAPKHRSFCEMIYWTGARPSECLHLTAMNIDLSEGMVVIRSLKKRGALKGRHLRAVPVPMEFIRRLDAIHGIEKAQFLNDRSAKACLWPFSRTTGWRLMKQMMEIAGISGVKANARGLRHSLGVHAAVSEIPGPRIQAWLGHASLETTAVYMNASGQEDRAIAERMWQNSHHSFE